MVRSGLRYKQQRNDRGRERRSRIRIQKSGFSVLEPLSLGSVPGCYATAINDDGIIVGGSYEPGALDFAALLSSLRATFWLGGGMPNDLNSVVTNLGNWQLSRAAAVNVHGDIAGWGRLNGTSRAFLAKMDFSTIGIDHYFGGKVSASVEAGGSGFLVTADGRIVPIGPPTPDTRRAVILNNLRKLARAMAARDVDSSALEELAKLISERLK